MSIVRVRGSSWDTQDNLVVDTIPELANVRWEGIIFVAGAKRINDGSGGWFKWDDTESRANDDGFDVIDPTSTKTGRGCWVRMKYVTAPPNKVASEVIKATAGQDTFKLNSIRYSPGSGSISVYVNGTRLAPYAYTEVDSETIRINTPLRANDVVEVLHLDNPVGGGNLLVHAREVEFEPGNTNFQQSDTVQEALQQIDLALRQVQGGAGGGNLILGAIDIPYMPTGPDASNNVQDGMAWIQQLATKHIMQQTNAHKAGAISYDPLNYPDNTKLNVQDVLDDLSKRVGQGVAKDINFDNSNTPLIGNNVQTAVAGLYLRQQGAIDNLEQHLVDSHDAHKAEAIYFASLLPRFMALSNVHEALEKLSDDLDQHEMIADNVKYDQTHYQLGETVQLAITTVKSDIDQHVGMPGGAHKASAIDFDPTPNIVATTVQAAIDQVDRNIDDHVIMNTAAHDASAILFHPANNPLNATDVEQAILEVIPGRARYRGGVRIDQAFNAGQFTPSLENNDYVTVIVATAPDPSWPIHGMPPGMTTLSDGDKLVWDGSAFWFIPGRVPANAIVTDPPAGTAQMILAPDVQHAALRLAGVTNQEVPVFEVFGDSRFHGILEDAAGNVRQDAAAVPFDASTSDLNSGNVQLAIQELVLRDGWHIAGSRTDMRHNATAINFQPVLGIRSLDVQGAIRDVAAMLDDHKTKHAAHKAADLTFANTGLNIAATSVQGALEVVIKDLEKHTSGTNVHAATDIQFDNTKVKMSSTNVQDALIEVFNTVSGARIDGGSY